MYISIIYVYIYNWYMYISIIYVHICMFQSYMYIDIHYWIHMYIFNIEYILNIIQYYTKYKINIYELILIYTYIREREKEYIPLYSEIIYFSMNHRYFIFCVIIQYYFLLFLIVLASAIGSSFNRHLLTYPTIVECCFCCFWELSYILPLYCLLFNFSCQIYCILRGNSTIFFWFPAHE